MLKLLEEHHHRLAEIIKTKDVIAKQLLETGQHSRQTVEDTDPTTPSSPPHTAPEASYQTQRPSASNFNKMRQQRRESSPALAKDIASRRGIPQPQTRKIPPPIVDARPARSSATESLLSHQQASKDRNTSDVSHAASTAQSHRPKTTTAADDAFSRFYSNLTAGPFSKISSMLAFAAMPLSETSSQPSSPESSRTESTSARAHHEPDLGTLISPAALNAMEEAQRRKGHSGQVFGPGESFYVVPTSGGTTSYANIMRTEQRYARRQGHLSNISEEDNEFVDARETQVSRNSVPAHHAPGGPSGYRVEELELENDSLKQVLDQMSHRLQAFERSAQDASMAALTQSMASVRTQNEDDIQNLIRENSKLKGQNQKYKDYIDRLRDSARQKDKERKERSERPA